MTDPKELKSPRSKLRSWPHRWLRRLLLFVIFLAVLLGTLYFYRIEILGPRIRDEIELALSQELGGRYEIESVSGGLFGDLQIQGLKTIDKGRLFHRLEFSEARLHYRLLDLLAANPVAAFDRVEIDDLVIELGEFKNERKTKPRGGEAVLEAKGLLSQIPERFPDLSLKGELHLPFLDAMEIWSFDVCGQKHEIEIVAKKRESERSGDEQLELHFTHDPQNSLTVALSGNLMGIQIDDIQGRLSAEDRIAGEARLLLPSGTIELEAKGDRLLAQFKNLEIAQLPPIFQEQLRGQLKTPPESGRVSGEVRWNLQSQQIETDTTIESLHWGRIENAHLSLRGQLLNSHLTLSQLLFKESQATAVIEDLELDLREIWTSAVVRKAEIEIEDIKRLTELVPDLAWAAELPDGLSMKTSFAGRPESARLDHLEVDGENLQLRAHGSFQVPPHPEDWRLFGLQLEIAAAIDDAQDLLPTRERSPPLWRSNLEFEGRIEKPKGSAIENCWGEFNLLAKEAVIDRLKISGLEMKAGLSWPLLKLSRLRATTENSLLTAEVEVDLSQASSPRFKLTGSVDSQDLAELSCLIPSLQGIRGTAEFNAELEGEWNNLLSSLRGRSRAHLRDLRIDDRELGEFTLDLNREPEAALDFDANLQSRDLGDWKIQAQVSQEDLEVNFKINELSVEKSGTPIRLASATQGHLVLGESFAMDPAAFDLLGGHASLNSSWTADRGIDLLIEAKSLNLESLPLDLLGNLDHVELRLQGDFEKPTWSAQLKSRDLRRGNESVELELRARQEGEGIFIDEMGLISAYGKVEGRGQCPLRLGSQGLLWNPAGQANLALKITAADLNILKNLGLPVELWSRSLDGQLNWNADGLKLKALLSAPQILADAREPGLTEALTFDLEMVGAKALLRLDAGTEGQAEVQLSLLEAWKRPRQEVVIAGELASLLDFEKISGKAHFLFPDLSQFEFLSKDLLRCEGAANIDLAWADLSPQSDLSGTLALDAISLRIEGFPGITVESAELKIANRNLRIESFAGELGYAPFTLSGGLNWEGGSQFNTDLELKGQNLLVYRNRYARARCDLDCRISGAIEALHFQGKAQVTDANYSEPIRFLDASTEATAPGAQIFSLRDSLLENATFDIEILADKTILVANNVAYGRLSADLHLGGSGAYPEPRGRVNFRDFQLTLPFSKLAVSRGELLFDPIRQMDPKLSIFASTRMRGYDLNIQVRGTSSAPIIDVAANPPLPREEALILLTTGATPGQLKDQGLTEATLTRTGQLIGQSILEAFSDPSDPKRDGYLDRFSLEVGRDVSSSGTSTIESEVRLTEHYFIRFERDRYEEHNLGVVWRLRFK